MRDDKSIRGTAAKREARELRRAMGVEALSVISDHEDAISTIGAGLHKAQIDVATLDGKMALREHVASNHAEAMKFIAETLHALDDRAKSFDAMTFRDRLRWLFKGR